MTDELKGFRGKTTKLKTARGRKNSSQRWLQRQLNDPYVQQAKNKGYRSRAAFKLLEIQQKYKILHPGQTIVDLGAAPGGWSQVAVDIIQSGEKNCRVVGLDLLEISPLAGAIFLQADFTTDEGLDLLMSHVSGPIDVVLSDIAPSTTGHKGTDHIRIVDMVSMVIDFSIKTLKPDGCLIAKVFQGGTESTLLNIIKKHFTKASHFKPPASRKESNEIYLIAEGFKGKNFLDEAS